MAICMLKIRRPLGRLIFNMGIAIPGKTVLLRRPPGGCLTNVLQALQNTGFPQGLENLEK